MRIEVLIESDEPKIYPLNSPKILIGSGESCDVVLPSGRVSRKHLVVLTENDNYYVVDQGSTNGSFINEERLVPGRKVEFTSFFPVRLGDNVLISLISDEEALDFPLSSLKEKTSSSIKAPPPDDEQTDVIRPFDLYKVKTERLVLESQKKREITRKAANPNQKKAETKKGEGFSNKILGIIGLGIIGIAAYINLQVMKPEADVLPEEVVTEAPAVEPVEVPAINKDLIPKDELITHDKFIKLRDNLLCTTDVEQYLCKAIPGIDGKKFGVTQNGTSFYAFIDASSFANEAKLLVPPTDSETSESKELLRQAAVFVFFVKHMPELDVKILADSNLYIGFFIPEESQDRLLGIAALKPNVFNREKNRITEEQLRYIKTAGLAPMDEARSIYILY